MAFDSIMTTMRANTPFLCSFRKVYDPDFNLVECMWLAFSPEKENLF